MKVGNRQEQIVHNKVNVNYFKHIKRAPTSFTIGGIEIKSTMANYFVLTKLANIKEWIIYCTAKGLEKQTLIFL